MPANYDSLQRLLCDVYGFIQTATMPRALPFPDFEDRAERFAECSQLFVLPRQLKLWCGVELLERMWTIALYNLRLEVGLSVLWVSHRGDPRDSFSTLSWTVRNSRNVIGHAG